MRFTRDSISARYMPRGYRPGELRINDTPYTAPLILSADQLLEGPRVGAASELRPQHADALLAQSPEVVLLGTGAQHDFAPAAFGARFLAQGIGFEAMGTAAACRTFNVLVAEQRRVVALLLP